MATTLDLVQLRTLVTIADCGGFGKAAAVLHLSQPTVSQHVRQLERRLDTTLVEKDGRKAKFTESGERLLQEARHLLSVHDDVLARLDVSGPRTLVIGTAASEAARILPRLMSAIEEEFPEFKVKPQIDRPSSISQGVERGEIDLGLVYGFAASSPGTTVDGFELGWFAAPGTPGPGQTDVVPLVVQLEPCRIRARALHRLNERGVRIEIAAEASSAEGVSQVAKGGLGFAPLSVGVGRASGLERRYDLPDLGSVDIKLVARRGIPEGIEELALAVLAELGDDTQRLLSA